ncbi:MAG: hypothetical protein HW396_495 [Candidatus Dadabacteria bacterium]|nr:hypothetical protein [Candidatus Dadabacteria bacterium]
MKIDSPFLLDTNILIYAADSEFEFHFKAKEIRDNAINGKIEAYITTQVLAEFCSTITSSKRVNNPLTPELAKTEVENYLSTPLKMIFIKENTVKRAVELAVRHILTGAKIFDALLAATMLDNRIYTICTFNDSDFSKFTGIKVINPTAIT